MSVVGAVLRETLRWKQLRSRTQEDPYAQQLRQLRYQLRRAKHTEFGKKYNFDNLLRNTSAALNGSKSTSEALRSAAQAFAAQVPIFTYEQMHQQWWHLLRKGVADLCWPGQITHFALSSGTSQANTKRIPVTTEMLQSMRYVSMRQLCAIANCGLPLDFYTRSLLFLGSSTSLQQQGTYVEGDISGIMARAVPLWLRYHYRPSMRTAQLHGWEERLDAIVKEAPGWQIGGMSGSPTWVQLLLERIIEHYRLSDIHDLWPDFRLFVHGGVAFDSYKETFRKMLGKQLTYLETYLASEGFIAYQASPDRAMRLALDAGLFYEFMPFSPTEEPSPSTSTATYSLSEVEINKPYALIISNLSGLWRYAIGDVVVFRSRSPFEINIVGRTQHYLSLCGEHLCLDNLQAALAEASAAIRLPVKEFTVFGEQIGGRFVHNWHIGIEKGASTALASSISEQLDAALKVRNADYCLQRRVILAPPRVELLPSSQFYNWLKTQGKLGGQYKFPRVLRGERLESWLSQIQQGRDH